MDECLDMQSVDLNFGQMFFMMLGFLPVMMCLPCWFVALAECKRLRHTT